MGLFDFGTNIDNIVNKTTNDTVNSYFNKAENSYTATIGADQSINIGTVSCSGGSITNNISGDMKIINRIDNKSTVKLMNNVATDIVSNITQATKKSVSGLAGALANASSIFDFSANIANTENDVRNSLTNTTHIENIQKIVERFSSKQDITIDNVTGMPPDYKCPDIGNDFLINVVSNQISNVVSTALSSNQAFTTMKTTVSQTVSNIAKGGLLLLFIVLLMIVGVAAHAYTKGKGKGKGNGTGNGKGNSGLTNHISKAVTIAKKANMI